MPALAKLLDITQSTIIQDINDVFNDVVIIENADMVVASTQKIAQRYTLATSSDSQKLWATKEISKNSAGDTILIKIIEISHVKPNWVPFSDESFL